MTIEELFPERRSVSLDSAYADLGFEQRAEGLCRPYVVANMVSSVDGRASLGGRTKDISSPADRALFHALRGQVDAVMAGTGTIGIEGYGPIAGGALAVTASRSLELPVAAPLFQDPQSRIVVLTDRDGEVPDAPAEVIVEQAADFVAGLERLRERHGVRTLLLEGGPTLLAAMLETGVVHELFLTQAPLLVDGTEPSLLEGPPLREPVSLRLVSLLKAEEYLFARYAVGA